MNKSNNTCMEPIFRLLNSSKFSGIKQTSLENNAFRTVYTRYFLPAVEIKDYNVMTAESAICDQPGKSDIRTYKKHSKD